MFSGVVEQLYSLADRRLPVGQPFLAVCVTSAKPTTEIETDRNICPIVEFQCTILTPGSGRH